MVDSVILRLCIPRVKSDYPALLAANILWGLSEMGIRYRVVAWLRGRKRVVFGSAAPQLITVMRVINE